jgi:hypothetical protein
MRVTDFGEEALARLRAQSGETWLPEPSFLKSKFNSSIAKEAVL